MLFLILLILHLVMIELYFLGSSVLHVNEGLNNDNHLSLIDLTLHFLFVCITGNHSQNSQDRISLNTGLCLIVFAQ